MQGPGVQNGSLLRSPTEVTRLGRPVKCAAARIKIQAREMGPSLSGAGSPQQRSISTPQTQQTNALTGHKPQGHKWGQDASPGGHQPTLGRRQGTEEQSRPGTSKLEQLALQGRGWAVGDMSGCAGYADSGCERCLPAPHDGKDRQTGGPESRDRAPQASRVERVHLHPTVHSSLTCTKFSFGQQFRSPLLGAQCVCRPNTAGDGGRSHRNTTQGRRKSSQVKMLVKERKPSVVRKIIKLRKNRSMYRK